MWSYTKTEELYHHGILGQKWGKRNGPPYPLDANDHSASEKKAGYKKSLDGGRNEELYDRNRSSKKKFQLSENQKKAIKIGSAVAVTALAAYGAYKVYDNNLQLQGYAKLGKKNMDFIKAGGLDLEARGIDVNASPEEIAAELKKINPSGNHNNCGPCAFGTVLNIQGRDLVALPRENGTRLDTIMGDLFGETATENALRLIRKTKTADEMSDMLKRRYEDGSSGVISFSNIKAGNSRFRISENSDPVGHAFSWYINKGEVHYCDGQNGLIDASRYFSMMADDSFIEFARIDNLALKEENLSKYFYVR